MEYWCTVVGANNRSIPIDAAQGFLWFDLEAIRPEWFALECVHTGTIDVPHCHSCINDIPTAGFLKWKIPHMTWPPPGTLLRLEPYHSCAHTKQHDRHLGCARSWDAGGTRTLFGSGSTSFMTSFRKSMYKRRIKDTELCCLCSAHFQSRPWIWRPTSRLAVFRNLEPLTDQKGTAAGPPRSNYCQVQDLPQRLEWDTGLPKNTLDVFFFQSLTINKYIDI